MTGFNCAGCRKERFLGYKLRRKMVNRVVENDRMLFQVKIETRNPGVVHPQPEWSGIIALQ